MPDVPLQQALPSQRIRDFTRTSLLLARRFCAAFGAGFAYASWAMVCRAGRCPSAEALDDYEPHQTSKLYAADGRFIAELGLERRTLVKFDDIPPLVRKAFVVTEDKRFYQHAGIDWIRVPGALLVDIKKRNFSEGFSTITMQLARNIFPERISRDKTLIRKLKEAKVAREIEAQYSKDKILELYLNQIYLGNGAYGVETASQRYFGKSLNDLNLAEAATLAALPKAPERYNPAQVPRTRHPAAQHRHRADARREARSMPPHASEAQGVSAAARAHASKPARPRRTSSSGFGSSSTSKFGKQLYEQGLKVYTTLDLDMQSAGRARARAPDPRDRGGQVRRRSRT